MKLKWKLFLILLGLSIFGLLAIIPYTLTLQGGLPQNLPVPLYVILAAQIIQNIIIFAVAIFIGLYLYKKVDLSIPVLESWLRGNPVKDY
ncbi:MAG: CPBP family intramembrane glutamate endopeptidase, partial [Methanobacterium sp.]